MTRFRVSDTFGDHPKAELAGNAAVGAWTRMGSYSPRYLTEGFIPGRVATRYGTSEEIDALVSAGLLLSLPNGYLMHDFLEDNPTKARVEQEREAAKKRAAASRAARGSARRAPATSGERAGARATERDGAGHAERARTSSSFRTTTGAGASAPLRAVEDKCDLHRLTLPCRGCAADALVGETA